MNRTIVFATSNENKIREVNEMIKFESLDFKIISLKDLNLKVTHPEDSDTFIGNAKIKAEDIAKKCNYPVLSDDSGLSINALNGFPGVHSARFMEGHSYHEKNEAILKMLEDKKDRSAYFTTAMVYIDKKNNIEKVFIGKNDGEIALTIDENPVSGFGYDPIFFSYDLNKRFSQVTPILKDSVSHRGRALKQVIEFLKGNNKDE